MSKFDYLIEHTYSQEQIFAGDFLKVKRAIVELPNKKSAIREYIQHPKAVAIIAITDNHHIILEYQYRYPVQQVILEIPAGKAENSETTLSAAKRELVEETGYQANKWVKLGKCLPCIAYSTEIIIYYLAQELKLAKTNPDDGEFIQITTMHIDEMINLAYSGKVSDSKTLCGIMLYLGYLNKKS